jgi:hypothetical protein
MWTVDLQKVRLPSTSPPAYRISKRTPWDRMTSDEAAEIGAALELTETKLRSIYEAATFLASDDPLFPMIRETIVSIVGASRADELLMPED